jgi:hypothetical protein
MREIGDDNNTANTAMTHIQESNNVSTLFLSWHGFDGNVFKDNVKKVSRKSVRVQHLTQELKNKQATTHCDVF